MTQPPSSPRDRLLDAAIDHVAEHGLGDLSLRQLGPALGTSHRMLVYHFGSKEGLLVAVVQAVEARQRAALIAIANDPALADLSLADRLRQTWDRFADRALWPHERLFFEVYGQALQGRPHTTSLLDGIVENWVAPAVAIYIAHGVPPEAARDHARLGVAVIRGLLLDLLATGDRAGVDRAFALYVTAMAAELESAGSRNR
jgi:AcrR family transcriptional regulator